MALFQYGYGRFGTFSQALVFLEQLGLLDALIPFALIFAVFYAILDQTEIFKAGRRINAVVALSVALLTVIPHVLGYYPPGADVVVILNRAAPEIALIAIALVLVLILTGLMSGTSGSNLTLFKDYAQWIALALVALVVYGAIAPPTWVPGFLALFTDPYLMSVLIILLVFGLVVWAVVGFSSDGTPPPTPPPPPRHP